MRWARGVWGDRRGQRGRNVNREKARACEIKKKSLHPRENIKGASKGSVKKTSSRREFEACPEKHVNAPKKYSNEPNTDSGRRVLLEKVLYQKPEDIQQGKESSRLHQLVRGRGKCY